MTGYKEKYLMVKSKPKSSMGQCVYSETMKEAEAKRLKLFKQGFKVSRIAKNPNECYK